MVFRTGLNVLLWTVDRGLTVLLWSIDRGLKELLWSVDRGLKVLLWSVDRKSQFFSLGPLNYAYSDYSTFKDQIF